MNYCCVTTKTMPTMWFHSLFFAFETIKSELKRRSEWETDARSEGDIVHRSQVITLRSFVLSADFHSVFFEDLCCWRRRRWYGVDECLNGERQTMIKTINDEWWTFHSAFNGKRKWWDSCLIVCGKSCVSSLWIRKGMDIFSSYFLRLFSQSIIESICELIFWRMIQLWAIAVWTVDGICHVEKRFNGIQVLIGTLWITGQRIKRMQAVSYRGKSRYCKHSVECGMRWVEAVGWLVHFWTSLRWARGGWVNCWFFAELNEFLISIFRKR